MPDEVRRTGKMRFRKLERTEHSVTRPLWEKIFTDDTEKFLDYYYTVKTKDNEIYAAENEQGELCSMLQLNPYRMKMGQSEFLSHYIIAVATRPEYRKQGLMRELLNRSMGDMYQCGEAFTFLMPAAEVIYRPFDFRFIYNQRQGWVDGFAGGKGQFEMRKAVSSDCGQIAVFARKQLAGYSVYAIRDAAYYECMLKEQTSENGGVMLILDQGITVGVFAYAYEGTYEIREPLIEAGYEDAFREAVYHLTQEEGSAVKCYGYEGDLEYLVLKPNIMVRVLHPEQVLVQMRVREALDVRFNIIDFIIKENNVCVHLQAEKGEYIKVSMAETNSKADAISIAALTSLMFGYLEVDEILLEEGVSISEAGAAQLRKMEPLSKIFLNEVV